MTINLIHTCKTFAANLKKTFVPQTSRARKPRRLGIESLEARQLMTAAPASVQVAQLVAGAGIESPTQVVLPAVIPLPPVGLPFIDQVFGTTLRRVSNTSDQGGFETQIYSQLQAFSADNQHLLLTGSNGYVIRRVDRLSLVPGLDTSEWNAPRWHPTRPGTIVHFDTNVDNDVTVQFTDVTTGATTNVFTFPGQYTHAINNQSFDELSDDGRWMAGMVRRSDGQPVLFSLDLPNSRLGAVMSLHDIYTTHAQPDPQWGEVEPDWVGVSPLGRYLVVGWKRDGTAGASGVETFDIQTGAFTGRVNDGHQHGDLGVLPDGTTEYYMTFEVYGSPADNNRPAIGLRLLPGNPVVSQPTYLQSIDWGNAEHISARGPNGVALITSGTDPSNGWTAYEGELWLQYADNRVLRLVHHRSTSSDYWVQPRATISRDGRYIVFASDWGRQTGGRGDPYLIDLGNTMPPPPLPPPPPPPPELQIADVTVQEGDAGTVPANFRVTLSSASALVVTVRYTTANGSATAASDYQAATGTLTFHPGETLKTIPVPVRGDLLDEPNETFRVRLTGSTNATIARGQATATILDNDPPTAITIGNTSVQEGNAGTRFAVFSVSLSAASGKRVTVRYGTANGTARAGSDYLATSGTLTFNPGETVKTIRVAVRGDMSVEANESFFVNLSQPRNATLATRRGVGTILNDDGLSAALAWARIGSLGDGNGWPSGRNGNDRLFGEAGLDWLFGNAGNNRTSQ